LVQKQLISWSDTRGRGVARCNMTLSGFGFADTKCFPTARVEPRTQEGGALHRATWHSLLSELAEAKCLPAARVERWTQEGGALHRATWHFLLSNSRIQKARLRRELKAEPKREGRCTVQHGTLSCLDQRKQSSTTTLIHRSRAQRSSSAVGSRSDIRLSSYRSRPLCHANDLSGWGQAQLMQERPSGRPGRL
jgi:hypothetical protein